MDHKKKIAITMKACAIASLLALTGAILVQSGLSETANLYDVAAKDADGNYVLALAEASSLGGGSSVVVATETGASVTLTAAGISARSGALGEFAAGATLVNASPLTGLKKIAIDFDSTGTVNALKIIPGIKNGDNIVYDEALAQELSADGTFTLSDKTTLDIAYFKIINAGTGVSDVGSISLTYACTKSVTGYQKVTYSVEGAVAKSEYVATGSTLPSTYKPTLAGYTFKEWTDASGTSVSGSTISADTTVYSSWYRNVEEGVSGAVKKDFHLFTSGDGVTTTATVGTFSEGEGTITGFAVNTNYTFTLPAIDFATALATGGEISFDLYSNWKEYSIAGFSVPYEAEHTSADPYHIMIKANGVGYGVYASATTEGAYGELGTLPSGIADGTTGMTIGVVVGGNASDVHFTKMSYYTLDYKPIIASALSTLTSSATVANLANYQAAVAANLTTYEKSQYSEPSAVTAAKTSLAGQSQTAFSFPTISDYYTSTQAMRTGAATVGLFTDNYNATGDSDDASYYAWSFQTVSGVTSAYLELPRIAYSAYSEVTFKTWMTAKGSFSVNGTQLEAGSDAANQDWGYVIKIVTSGSISVMTVYHGDGSKGAMTQVQATYTLPENVANGRIPLHFVEGTSTAWTGNTVWGLTNVNGTI